MCGHVLEGLTEIHEQVNKRAYVRDGLRLAPVYPRLAGQPHDLVLDKIVVSRRRHQFRI
jgi:hypothetical protein